MTTSSQRILAIADIIERYVMEHPRAADTAEGICGWWVARQRHSDSLEEVRQALQHLAELGRLSRTTLADGTVIYTRTRPPDRSPAPAT